MENCKPCPAVVRPEADGHCFELKNDDLERLLTHRDIVNLPVVVVSVAGGFRLGKSFLLGFFIRYLEKLETSPNPPDWVGENDIPLKGFSWRYGSARETTGILLWGKVFKVNTKDHGQVAVVLMDTEGSFDSTSTMEGNVTIFSMSMLLSSVQVYNVSKQITQSDLEHLKLFAEYATMARSAGSEEKEAFQKLVFLIRDWQYPDEKPYGLEGGQELLDPWLESKACLPREVIELRENIRSSFKELKCFLMPKPGDKVESKKFDGRLSDISEDFKHQLKDIVPYLLSPESLIPKKVNGRMIKCKELLGMFQAYFTVFKEKQLPTPMAVFDATAFVHNKRVIEDIVRNYETIMAKIVKRNLDSQHDRHVEAEHEKLMNECLEQFDKAPKMGRNVKDLRERIKKEINGRYAILKNLRETLQEFHDDMEHRLKREKEEAQRSFQDRMKQLEEDLKNQNEEYIKEMARIHDLKISEMERKAMARQTEESSIWDVIAGGINALLSMTGMDRWLQGLFGQAAGDRGIEGRR